jgi:hypothetical protein
VRFTILLFLVKQSAQPKLFGIIVSLLLAKDLLRCTSLEEEEEGGLQSTTEPG